MVQKKVGAFLSQMRKNDFLKRSLPRKSALTTRPYHTGKQVYTKLKDTEPNPHYNHIA